MINKKTLTAVAILIGITILTHQAWLLSFATIIGSDWGFFYPQTMQEWFPIHSIWNPQLNFGYYDFVSVPFLLPYFLRSSLAVLHVDFNIIDRLLYLYPVALLAPLAMFFLCFQLTKNRKASVIGALVYSINTYFLTIQIGHFTLALVYALFPLIFLVFNSFLKTPKYLKLLLLLLLLFIAFSNEARIAFLGIMVLFFYFIFSLFYLRKQYSFKKFGTISGYIIFGGILFLGLLSFMIVPLLLFRDIGIEEVAGRGFFGAEFFPIQNAFTLFHPFWNGVITTEFIPQPIPFYFWSFPIVAFASLFFIKRDKKILFFASLALIGIFLGKGITDPLGNIYSWLYFKVPGFSFFREPSKFYFIIAFAYSVLFAYFTAGFFEQKKSRLTSGVKYIITKSLYLVLLAVVFVVIASPVIHGTLGDAFRKTSVPEEYYALKDYLVNQKEFFRTMYIPNYQRFQVLTENHPSIAYYGVNKDLQTINPEILKLFSVKYIIAPYDSTNDVYRHYAPREIWERKISEHKEFEKVNIPALGKISVYENTLGYLPHIYAADNDIYLNSDASLLKNIAPLLPDKKNALYFSNSLKNTDKDYYSEDHPLLNTSYRVASCIRCEHINPWEDFAYPFAKFLPDSPFYFYVKQKEEDSLEELKNDPQAYHLQEAFYSLKRIIEAQRIVELNLHIEYLKRVLADHRKTSDSLSTYYNQIDNNKLQNNDYLLKLRDFVLVEQKIMGDIMRGKAEDDDLTITNLLQDEYYRLDEHVKKIDKKVWLSTETVKRYTVDIPTRQNVEVLVKQNSTYPEFDLRLDNQKLSTTSQSNGWLAFGEKTIEKGLHPLSIEIKGEKNLVATGEAVFTAEANQGVKKYSLPISLFGDAKELIVSFSYQSPQGKPSRFFLSQDADRVSNGMREVELNQYLKTGNAWNTAWGKVVPKEGARKANLEFWLEGQVGQDATLLVKDLKVTAVVEPLVLLKENHVVSSQKPVNVTIKTISPAHYQALISGARQPFTLVFNEQFHNGWKASIDKQTIADEKHVEMNGYANAWFIDKNGDFTVDIYFTPQKYYTIGIGLSLTILALIVLSAIIFRKR